MNKPERASLRTLGGSFRCPRADEPKEYVIETSNVLTLLVTVHAFFINVGRQAGWGEVGSWEMGG